jgi:hypothetical protein
MDGATGVPSYARRMNPETNMMCYGLGWVVQDFRGQHMLSHGGSIDGFRSQVALVPKARLGIAILSNLGRTQMPEALRNNLVEMILELPRRDWNAFYLGHHKKQLEETRTRQKEREAKQQKGTKPSHDLAAYAGTFDDPAYGPVTVTVDGESLVLKWSTFTARLEHFHYDTFTARGDSKVLDNPLGEVPIVFTLNADGAVTAVNLLSVDFKRVK